MQRILKTLFLGHRIVSHCQKRSGHYHSANGTAAKYFIITERKTRFSTPMSMRFLIREH